MPNTEGHEIQKSPKHKSVLTRIEDIVSLVGVVNQILHLYIIIDLLKTEATENEQRVFDLRLSVLLTKLLSVLFFFFS